MELRELRIFAAVVEAGSFTGAAPRLHMTQPSISVAIAKLETQLGVRLLVRRGRGVEPTVAGRALMIGASRLLANAATLEADLRRLGAGEGGAITLAAVPALGWSLVPRILEAHSEAAPAVETRLIDPPPWEAVDLVLGKGADLALVLVADAEAFTARYRHELDIRIVGDAPLVAASAKPLPTPLPLHALNDETLILPSSSPAIASLPEVVRETLMTHRVTPQRIRTAGTIGLSVSLIEAGLGIGVLPDADGLSVRRFRVHTAPTEPALPALRILALTRPNAREDALIARMLDVISAVTL